MSKGNKYKIELGDQRFSWSQEDIDRLIEIVSNNTKTCEQVGDKLAVEFIDDFYLVTVGNDRYPASRVQLEAVHTVLRDAGITGKIYVVPHTVQIRRVEA